MKKILVIGATGFVGKHTLSWLMQQVKGVHLVAACRDASRLPKGFSGEIRVGDIRDSNYLSSVLDDIDVLVNCAAWSSLWGHRQHSDRLFLQPSLQLIDYFLASKASRFINISSVSAAAPEHSEDALSRGIPRDYWPHLSNVIAIENYLRDCSVPGSIIPSKTVINLRFGIFAGKDYALGLLPVLLPRLKTHLVPWVQGGKPHIPLIDGRDIGQAMGLAACDETLQGFHSFNVVGKSIPTMRELIQFLHNEYGYPKPHFSVPFSVAYTFARLMEALDSVLPFEPLIVRSIVHLLEETGANNKAMSECLAYQPAYDWKTSVRDQIAEMQRRQERAMSMAVTVK